MLLQKRYQTKKGMTLIELVAAIAILGVVMAAIMSLFMSGINFFRIGNLKSQTQSDARLAINAISENIKYALEVEIMNEASVPALELMSDDDNYFYIDSGSGMLLHVQTDGSTHSSRSIAHIGQVSFSELDYKTVRITITVTESSETYQITSDIVLENFLINTSLAIDGLTSGNAIRYQVKTEGLE